VAHICPACWGPAERITGEFTVKCLAGHVSCMRCGRSRCVCVEAERAVLTASPL
jgi:hypothetical protein